MKVLSRLDYCYWIEDRYIIVLNLIKAKIKEMQLLVPAFYEILSEGEPKSYSENPRNLVKVSLTFFLIKICIIIYQHEFWKPTFVKKIVTSCVTYELKTVKLIWCFFLIDLKWCSQT